MSGNEVAVILPALNEVGCVEDVVHGFIRTGVRVIVVDNGSTDGTGLVASKAGAEVVIERLRGYGRACLAGLSYLSVNCAPKVVVFADCDGTLDAQNIWDLIEPIKSGRAELVLGRRVNVERGAMPMHQKLGNTITCILLRVFYGLRISDIPPYRAASWSFLSQLPLSEKSFGFPIETVALTARRRGRLEEVEVEYHCRAAGQSKVTGSLSTALLAGLTMITVLISLRFRRITV